MGVGGDLAAWDEDTVVIDNVIVNPNKLIITETISIENHGVISVDVLDVCPRCDVRFENYNLINFNDVFLDEDARIFQIVSNVDNMNPVNIDAEYTVVVNGNNNLSLADVVDVASGTGRVLLNDTTVHINSVPKNLSKSVEIGENVKFVIHDIDDLYNVILLDNVSGGSTAKFISNKDDIMYVTVGDVSDGKLFIKHIRETDYSVIFDNDMGLFINSLRANNKHSDFMYALDSAVDKDDLYSVMSESVLFNPDVLYRPLQIINTMNMRLFDDCVENTISANAFGIISDELYVYGADINLATEIGDNFNIIFGMQIAHLDYLSDLDEFSGMIYGLNLSTNYLFNNNFFVNLKSGVSVTQFDISAVMYNDNIQTEPSALFGYTVFDTGYKLQFDSFSVSPVVGIGIQLYDLSGIKYSDCMGRVGVISEYKYTISDLEYLYGASFVADTNGAVSVSGRIGFMSYTDMIGGTLDVSVTDIQDTVSYKISANAKFLF
jgi:hypothetical protein